MLLRAPEGWTQPVVAVIAMVLLAGLDLAGSLAAKEAVERRSVPLAVTGAVLFLAVFWVYISSLEVAELSAVTFGWIVILQVGVVLLDRFRYGVIPAPGAWLAIAVLLAAQAYLVLAPSGKPAVPADPPATEVGLEVGLVSAQRSHHRAEGLQHEPAELRDAERADADRADQQCLTDSLVSGVRHVSPQRDAADSSALTTQA